MAVGLRFAVGYIVDGIITGSLDGDIALCLTINDGCPLFGYNRPIPCIIVQGNIVMELQ